MTTTTSAFRERIGRYILDGSDQDLQRLLKISELTADTARAAFGQVGVQQGWNVIECGCGPIGGLAVLAELVGPTGRVVGVDFSEAAVDRARAVVGALGMDNVDVVLADVHDLDAGAVGGPFDLAFTRCFLMHQPDQAATLSRIASLLRPGGWIVGHEPLREPAPRSHPPTDALHAYWAMVHELALRVGVPAHAVDDLPRSAQAAGLEVVATQGFFNLLPPEVGFGLHAQTTVAMRDRALQLGVATGDEIDALVASLRAAANSDSAWVTSPFMLDLRLRLP